MDKKNILVVEDEVILALSTKQQLERAGYNVFHAISGEKTVSISLSDEYGIDLILMDINLGEGMDGTEAAVEILKYKDIPVVFLSSHTESEVVAKTEKITSYGYVVKNSGITVLDASVKMAFKLFEAHREISRKNMAIKAGNETLRITIEKVEETNRALEKAEKELKINLERFKWAQRIGRIGNWEYDIKTGELWASEETKRIFGILTDSEPLSVDKADLMTGDGKRMERALFDLIDKGEPYDIEYPITPLDGGKRIWIHSVAELKFDKDGNPVKVEGVTQDITAKKENEAVLEILRKAIDNASDIVFITNRKGIITFINKRFSEVYGYSPEEIVGKETPGILNEKKHFMGTDERFWSSLDREKRFVLDFENITKSGGRVFVETTIDPLYNESGELDGFLEIQRLTSSI